MRSDWFGLPQRRVGHEGLEVALQVLSLARPRTRYLNPPSAVSTSTNRIITIVQSLKVGGPILASNAGSILASAEVNPRARSAGIEIAARHEVNVRVLLPVLAAQAKS
jgi:hypothetical protein